MTRAARRLEIAQPALSQAIAQLESDLSLTLLDRHARGVTLTPAGAVLYEKARLAVAASRDAAQTAKSLARAHSGTIEFGFVGSPPGLDSPEQLEAFTLAHPEIEIRYRELPFPRLPTAEWMADVDVVACHAPPPDPGVWMQPLRREPRMILAPRRHPLSERDELAVEEVLDEVYIGLAEGIDPSWAGFWSLDDHRGGPPERVTSDGAGNPQEVLAALAMSDAITAIPSSVAGIIVNLLSNLAAIPLLDAEPLEIVLAGHGGRGNPLIDTLMAFAGTPITAPVKQGPAG